MLATVLLALSLATLPDRSPASSLADRYVPDGPILFARHGDIWTWSEGSARLLFRAQGATDPRWAPDGKAVPYVSVDDGFSDLVLQSLVDGQDTPLTENWPAFEVGSREYENNSVWVQGAARSATRTVAYPSEIDSWDMPVAL